MKGNIDPALAPLDENATPYEKLAGSVAGSLRLVPKPLDHGYVETYGDVGCVTAMSAPSELNATPFPVPTGSVAGSLYLVPKPLDQGYVETFGELSCPIAMSDITSPC